MIKFSRFYKLFKRCHWRQDIPDYWHICVWDHNSFGTVQWNESVDLIIRNILISFTTLVSRDLALMGWCDLGIEWPKNNICNVRPTKIFLQSLFQLLMCNYLMNSSITAKRKVCPIVLHTTMPHKIECQ